MKLQYNLVTWKYYKLIHKWRSSKKINSLMTTNVSKDYDNHLKWISESNKDIKFDHWIFLINSEPSGYLSLKLNSKYNASFGYYFVNKKLPIGSFMPLFFYNFVFKKTCIKKLTGQVLKKNKNIVKLHLSCKYEIINENRYSYVMELKKNNWDFDKYSNFNLKFPIRNKLKYLINS